MYVRLFRAKGTTRVALVRIVPATDPDRVMVLVARGASRSAMTDARQYGPMERGPAADVFAAEVAKLKAEGFLRSGLGDLLVRLESKKREKRALAARRLGFMGEAAAVEPLLALAKKANEETCVVVDALGRIGDPRAIEVARAAAERKLLSKRRSGVEALRRLGDKDGLSEARKRALERLPAPVLACLQGVAIDRGALLSAVKETPIKDRGLALDTLYELDLPGSSPVVRELLATEAISKPHLFRYAKSIWKRAMLRHDFPTFALLAVRFERIGRDDAGTKATLKSGYDGEPRSMLVFSPKTVHYLRRATWRFLRMLAGYAPGEYALAAAQILAHTTREDEVKPKGLKGTYSACYAFSHVLFGGSARHEFESRSLAHRLKASAIKTAAAAREEAHPDLWDAVPLAFVRALASASLPVVHAWAIAAITERHPNVLGSATYDDLVGMLRAPYEATVELGLVELRRRFDPENPDWDLLFALVKDERQSVRDLGAEWIGLTARKWALEPARVVHFFGATDPGIRNVVAGHVIAVLGDASPVARAAMAKAMLALLAGAPAFDGAHDAPASIARGLATEVATALSLEAILAGLSADASPAVQGVYAAAFAEKPGAETVYSPVELAELGAHANAFIRAAAHALLRRNIEALRADPSPLFTLLESAWADARVFARATLDRDLDPTTFSVDAILGLLDSSEFDAQDLGKSLVEKRFEDLFGGRGPLSSKEFLKRIGQHPSRSMRRYAVDMTVAHLGDGFVPLAATEDLFRAVLFDPTPDRHAKDKAIRFLADRGTRDAAQAEIAARLLGDIVRSATRRDFEAAIAGLAKIRIAFPSVDAPVALLTEAT